MEKTEKLANLRHSLAHLLAAAVMELYPDTKRTIGPAIDNGFYFDFEFSSPISDTDLPKIEKTMRKILPSWKTFERSELSADEAKKEYPDNPYKHELIDEFTKDGSKVSFYKSGNYWDLCKGGHTEDMSEIKADAFKLDRVAGAYWRGDEKNKMLTRVYGLAFETKEELDAYLTQREEAEKRDHKKLGKELDLFVFSELVGSGLPLWTPKGTILRNLLDDFVWELREKRGYVKVEIPHITKKDLYEKSGHWDKFKDELFRITTREGHEFAMKPMNCPHHTQIYDRKQWSYKELPQRYCNSTTCYRDEQSGELSGLSRVRSFTQDDAHVFCRMSQVKEEFLKVWDIVQDFYNAFGFSLRVRLSIRDPKEPEKYLGGADKWEHAETTLREIVTSKNVDWFEGVGEAAFYGPKLDFMAKDAIGREWQVATIQMDMNQPERFDLFCINEKGEQERIVMLHAAIMGSIDRFLSILIEHTAGNFPLWLAPVQVKVIPVRENHNEYAKEVFEMLTNAGIRAELDDKDGNLGGKVRDAKNNKLPYWIVIGDKEIEAGKVTLESRDAGQLGQMSKEELITKLTEEIKNRK
ncbi:MAG: threonine--tRNA ligase [Candidatus Paceibacterota bacterium]